MVGEQPLHPAQAWSHGRHVLVRYPWVALIPLAWNVGQMLLAFTGIPLGPVMDVGRALDPSLGWVMSPDVGPTLRLFLPSWLPGVQDLQVPIQPESLSLAVGMARGVQLTGLLLVPLLHALVQGLFLALLAQAATAGSVRLRVGLRVALTVLPALFALQLGWRLAVMTMSEGWLVGLVATWLLLYPLLPVSIAAGQQPLTGALRDAPGALWGQIGRWVGLGWRALLAVVLFTLGWSLVGRPLFLPLLVYPFLGTWIVAAAVALYLRPGFWPGTQMGVEPGTHQDAPTVTRSPDLPASESDGGSKGRAPWAWSLVLIAALTLTWLGGWFSAQWAGYRATREAVLSDPFPPYVAHVRQEGDHELVLYRADRGLGVAELERGRFGWKRLWSLNGHEISDHPARPATVHWERPYPSYGQFLVWGELYDSRVAYLEVAGERIAVGQESPLFLIPVAEVPDHVPGGFQNLRLLDALGREVLPDGEVQP